MHAALLLLPANTTLTQNELTFLRIRSKKHEIMVAPDNGYMLIVVQGDPDLAEPGAA